MRLNIFIDVDILVLVSEFVVVAILSEWWLVPITADLCGQIPRVFISLAVKCWEQSSREHTYDLTIEQSCTNLNIIQA